MAEFDYSKEEQANKDKEEKGRFFYLIEEKFVVRAGTVVVGVIHGRIDLGDPVYILSPKGLVTKSVVMGMETKIESYMMKIQTATDIPVNLLLNMDPAEIDRFSVITNVVPQLEADKGELIENPLMAGLLYGKRLFERKEYFGDLCFSIVHASLITPIRFKEKPEAGQRLRSILDAGNTVSFCMLSDPQEKGRKILPMFTDCTEFNRWEKFERDESVQLFVLNFQEILYAIQPVNYSGFVINPYSENRFVVPKWIIEMITSSEGYQEEFGQ